jgi:hypothetical protein
MGYRWAKEIERRAEPHASEDPLRPVTRSGAAALHARALAVYGVARALPGLPASERHLLANLAATADCERFERVVAVVAGDGAAAIFLDATPEERRRIARKATGLGLQVLCGDALRERIHAAAS